MPLVVTAISGRGRSAAAAAILVFGLPWFGLTTWTEIGTPLDRLGWVNGLDLFGEMKTAALLQKFAWNDPTVLPSHEALALATEHAHAALGFPGGRIEVGAPADLVLLETRIPCNTPLHHAVSNAVYACPGSAVTTTLCAGRVLMHERVIPGSDEVLDGAARAAASLVARALAGA